MSTPLPTDPATLAILERIAVALEALAADKAPPAPNLTRDIAGFAGFDWQSIGAHVTGYDQFGPAVVEHRGQTYKRRSPENKFGAAIWFSRPIGKDEEGRNVYARLITFKEFTPVEPISRSAEAKAGQPKPPAADPATAKPANGNGKQPPRPIMPAEPPPWEEFEDEWEKMPPAAQQPAQAAALAKAEERRAAKAAAPAKPLPIDHEILATVSQRETLKANSGFTGPATPEQWGLLKGLLEKAMGDKADRNIVLARLAGVEVKTVENPDWRAPKARAAAIIDWLVAKQPDGVTATRPYTVAEGRGTDLATVLQGAWGTLASAPTEDVPY